MWWIRDCAYRSIVPSGVGVGVPLDVSVCSSCLVARRVAVRLGPRRPRTGRHVSCILVLWVGRLRARAPNCRPPTFSLLARRETYPWAMLGFLCCVPIAKVSMSLVSWPPSRAPRGRRTDEKALLVPHSFVALSCGCRGLRVGARGLGCGK